jgi:hypothetical protein
MNTAADRTRHGEEERELSRVRTTRAQGMALVHGRDRCHVADGRRRRALSPSPALNALPEAGRLFRRAALAARNGGYCPRPGATGQREARSTTDSLAYSSARSSKLGNGATSSMELSVDRVKTLPSVSRDIGLVITAGTNEAEVMFREQRFYSIFDEVASS